MSESTEVAKRRFRLYLRAFIEPDAFHEKTINNEEEAVAIALGISHRESHTGPVSIGVFAEMHSDLLSTEVDCDDD